MNANKLDRCIRKAKRAAASVRRAYRQAPTYESCGIARLDQKFRKAL